MKALILAIVFALVPIMVNAQKAQPSPEQLKAAFARMDADQKGAIDRDEYERKLATAKKLINREDSLWYTNIHTTPGGNTLRVQVEISLKKKEVRIHHPYSDNCFRGGIPAVMEIDSYGEIKNGNIYISLEPNVSKDCSTIVFVLSPTTYELWEYNYWINPEKPENSTFKVVRKNYWMFDPKESKINL